MTNLAVRPVARKALCVVSARDTARDIVGQIEPGYRLVGVTKGQFSLLDLCEALIEQCDGPDVTITTWTPGAAEMERVLWLLTTARIRTFRLLVDRSFPGRHPQYVARVTEICGAESIRMTRTHAKFALIDGGGYKLTIRTSMNFNSNPRLEQFDIDDDPEIFALFDGILTAIQASAPSGLSATPREVESAFKHLLTPPPVGDVMTMQQLARFITDQEATP